MAELLFTSPTEMAETTILGSNIDQDKYTFMILSTQISVIEPLLGSLLYDKIISDIEGAGLSGDYLTLYDEFIKPITKNMAISEYIEVASFTLNNGGLFKHSPDNTELATREDAQFLAGKYSHLAQMYVMRFEEWICKNPLDEYKTSQDEVNAQKLQLGGDWFFGGSSNQNDGLFNDLTKY